MQPFEYTSPTKTDQVSALLGKSWGEVEILAGGSDLLSLMKDEVTTPKRLVNVSVLSEARIRAGSERWRDALARVR